ncbi:hypothetical protein D3C80_1474110 [compost metagenome]
MLTVVASILALLPGVQGEGLEATEAEFQAWPIGHWPREDEAPGHTLFGQTRNFRTAWVIEADQLGSLVERFTGSIVQALAQQFVLTDAIDPNQLGMATGNQQSDERKRWWVFFQHGRQQVTLHVVHTDRRDVPGKGQRLGAGSAHQQGTDQAGTRGVGDGVDFGGNAACLVQHLADERQHALDVITRGKLGHHAAEDAVQVDLAEQCVGQQTAFTVV